MIWNIYILMLGCRGLMVERRKEEEEKYSL